MSIIKLVRDADSYTRIPNATARDEHLKAESLGVIVFLSSWPDNWVVRETSVRKRFNWGRRKMRSVWGNLEACGYVQRLHRQRLEIGGIGTITHLAVTPHFLADTTFCGGTKCDTTKREADSAADTERTNLLRKSKQNRSNKKNRKRTNAKSVEKPTISINDAQNIVGVKFPNSICQLRDPSRVITLVLKYKLEPEQIRILFSQFDNYCSNYNIKDKWALFIDFIRRAQTNSLHLTSKSEANLAPWV